MKNLSSILLFILLLWGFSGCSDEIPPPVSRTYSVPTPSTKSGQDLARQISMKVEDISFRQHLKTKLMEKFDGDFNALWTSVFDSEALENDPLLQIAMPSLSTKTAENWNTTDDIPLVVYRSPEVDLNEVSELIAFDRGKEVVLDITREPDQLVLVISHNERLIYARKNKLPDLLSGRSCLIKPILSDSEYDYYLKQDAYDCTNEMASAGNEPEEDGCDRDQYNRQDHITRAKFATINIFRQAEHYLDGNPEVFFIVTLASKNPSGFSSLRKSYPSNDRSEWKACGIFSCKPEWFDKSLPVFNWDRTLFGDLVRYDWFEEDYSKAKVDLTLGLSTKISDVNVSGGVKITINEKDYFLDQEFVGYCDDANGYGTTYNTGKLFFTINQQ